MIRGRDGQKLAVYAVDTASGNAPKTGDAANITCAVSIDGAAPVALADVNPVEIDDTLAPGVYVFDLAADETDGAVLVFYPKSGTSDIRLEPVVVYPIDLAALLEHELGFETPTVGTIREALLLARAMARGTRRMVASGNRRFEELLMPDRATVLATREALPLSGPISRLVEHGDFTIELEAPARRERAGLRPYTGHQIEPPAGVRERTGQRPTLPVQVARGRVYRTGKMPTVFWS